MNRSVAAVRSYSPLPPSVAEGAVSREGTTDAEGAVRAGPGETSLLILPGYRFKVVERLITNFHLPRSTLLMLVSAFAGKDALMKAYQEAVLRKYRFYSYGDAMLIL